MSFTFMSVVVFPLLLVSALSVRRLLWLMMVLSPFEAAAALVVGGRGVTPAYLPVLMFISLIVLHASLGSRFRHSHRVFRIAAPLLFVLAYILVSAVTLPELFRNQLLVWPEKADPNAAWPIPLAPNSSNIAQSVYALLDLTVTGCVALVVSSWRISTREIYTSFLVTALVVEAFAFWQFGSRVAHLPFPTSLLDSNPSLAILSDQSWGGMPRVNGTFSEPAGLAFFLSGTIYSTAWVTLQQRGSRLTTAVLLLGFLSIVLCTSTTGFATIAFGGIALAAWVALRAPPAIARRFWSIVLPAMVVALLAAVVVPIVAPHVLEALVRISSETAAKSSSESFASRTRDDLDSLYVVVESYGLGAGWGSNRSSSLIPGLLSGMGVIGFGIVVLFSVRLASAMARSRARSLSPDELLLMQGGAAAIIGWLVASCLSGPTITSIPFFILLGSIIGVLARPHERRALPPARTRMAGATYPGLLQARSAARDMVDVSPR